MTSLPIQSLMRPASILPPLWPPLWPPVWRPQELGLGQNINSPPSGSAKQAALNVSAQTAAAQDSFVPSAVSEPSAAGKLYSEQLPIDATRTPPEQMPLLDQRIALAQWQTQQDAASQA